jgi:hypothetical protein
MIRDGGGDFERAEPGLCRAVCTHVVDLGIQESPEYGPKHQVALCFELEQRLTKGEHAGKPFMCSKIYTASTNKKAILRQHLDSWRGKSMTEEEARGFDLEKLIGVNCQLNLVEVAKNDKVYVNINAIVKASKGDAPLVSTGVAVPEWLLAMKKRGLSEEAAPLPSEPVGVVDMRSDDFPF